MRVTIPNNLFSTRPPSPQNFLLRWFRRAISSIAILTLSSMLFSPSAPSPAYALDVPTPLAPADGTITNIANSPPLGIPEFSWTAVAGATNYRLQISQDIGFTPANTIDVTTPNPRYTPVNTYISRLPDGALYWRVRVEAPAPAGEYSPISTFNKEWASPDNAPTLTSPAAGAVLDFYDPPTFTWQPVMGAASYCFQIATSDTGFGSACTTNATMPVAQATLATTYQPVTKLANGLYYWRVVPLDPGSRNGTSSEVRSFTQSYNLVPTLLEPADNATPTFTPTFRWTAVLGVQYYQLQYATDPTFSAGVTTVDTRNTTYTPLIPLSNDVNYYWRVRARSGNSVTDWSGSRMFRKQWYLQPELLTPVNNYQYVKDPFFSWTPVPGASHYKIEINNVSASSFPPIPFVNGWTETTVNPFYAQPDQIIGVTWAWSLATIWYWRVTPIDANGNPGVPSNVFSFGYNPGAKAPHLISPLYYYTPTASLQPHEDRTTSLPVFTWHRALSYTVPSTGYQADAYRIQVDDNPLFTSLNWTSDTQNLSAAPTASSPFTPTVGGIYYWRVYTLDGLGGAITSPASPVWKTRIDTSQGLAPTSTITLLRPASGWESVETPPLLEWWPLQGATAYEVQVSADPSFASVDIGATATYPAFTPQTSLGYGTYYWRVRGRSGGSPLGDWSAPWRFQVAAQGHWRLTRTLGDSGNQLLIGSDPAGDMTTANYDVTSLYASQSSSDWFFGFNANTAATDMQYVLYLDLDHVDNSGATSDAQGYNVATISAHRPEYALYILQSGSAFSAANVALYHWTGSDWASPQTLDGVGGALYSASNYVEIRVPNTAIGMQDTTGSASVSLFTVLESGGHAQDTVPSDPNVAYATPDSSSATTTLSRFTSVSERISLVMPPANTTGDTMLFSSIPPFRWHFPVDVSWYGYQFQAATDQQFTSVIWDYQLWANAAAGSPLIPPAHNYNEKDFIGDNTYYWRVRPINHVQNNQPAAKGAWSLPGRFERQGFAPQNLQTSVTFATPTFSWDMVEGATGHDVQVDTDPNFGSPDVSATTERNSYTPTSTLADGAYYWRVRVRRYSTIFGQTVLNDWTTPQPFILTLPQPTGLNHIPSGAVGRAPTLCWNPLLVSSGGVPVLAAYKYRIQVSKEPGFSTIFDTADTEQACWTSTRGYDDGTYYWRVAMMDGNSTPRFGSYSPAAQFTKQYPVTTLISPTNGSSAAVTPTFVWTPVNGAASYKLEVSQFPTFSQSYDSVTTNNTRFTPTKAYAIGFTYYWRVAIVDKEGKVGPFNTATIIVDANAQRLYLPVVIR